MLLDEALDMAFERGVGVTRAYALRTLAGDHSADDPHERMATAMTTLGERLADRAFKNLPAPHRRAALSWRESDPAQRMAVLVEFYLDLMGNQWATEKRVHPSEQSIVDRVLPAQCGSWTRGPIMPNCLGITQHMIGFARSAGARHLMVNTLTRCDEMGWRNHLKNFQIMDRALQGYPSVGKASRRVVWYIQKAIREDAKAIAEFVDSKQAHHCLLIHVSGSEWCLIDPYMGTFKPMIDETDDGPDMIWKELQQTPRATIMMRDLFTAHDETLLTKRLAKTLQQLFVARSDVARLRLNTIPSLLELEPIRQTVPINGDFTPEEKEILTHLPDDAKLTLSAQLSVIRTAYKSLWFRPSTPRGKDKRLKDFREYLDTAITQLMLMFVELMRCTTPPDIPPLMEVVHPAHFLGAATVHHVSVNSNPICDTRILGFASSQFMLYDCIRFRGNSWFDDYAIKSVMERIAPLPPCYIMPELELRLPSNWRHHHEHEQADAVGGSPARTGGREDA